MTDNELDFAVFPITRNGVDMAHGLTKRELFAAMAMQGAWNDLSDGNRPQHYKHTAESCVAIADALLEELEK